jgi:hypothetical protein
MFCSLSLNLGFSDVFFRVRLDCGFWEGVLRITVIFITPYQGLHCQHGSVLMLLTLITLLRWWLSSVFVSSGH